MNDRTSELLASKQKAHYEAIHDDYEAHYYDATSAEYRRRFIHDPLFEGLDLNGKTVADLASGSGLNSVLLRERFPGAEVVGFDISEPACEAYRQRTGSTSYELDLMAGSDPGVRVDAAMVIGGLHHCVSNLKGTFRTIANLLEPGGLLLMMEPNKKYLLEAPRNFWYSQDPYFEADTEAALSHEEIAGLAAGWFRPRRVRHLGGPAYFLIFNSLIFRVPIALKPVIAPALFLSESLCNLLPGRFLFPYFIAVWERTDEP
ncbi:MAG: class I SAM-dependent methyltransferase [Acidobacteriota bacterium]